MNLEESDAEINLPDHSAISPFITPDGKYLFFNRHSWPDEDLNFDIPDIYWVSTHFVENLKKEAFTSMDALPEVIELVSVFPNPANNLIRIKPTEKLLQFQEYKLIDVTGKLVKQGCLVSGEICISELHKGLYMLILNTNECEIIKKLVVN